MYIGSLMDSSSKLSGSYAFARRGTKKLCPPDICITGSAGDSSGTGQADKSMLDEGAQRVGGDCKLYEGILFSGNPFGWSGLKVFDVGVDLAIKFDCECYIDTVIVKLSEKSGLDDLTVLTQNQSGEVDIIGLREKNADPMIDEQGVSRYAVRRNDYSDKSKIIVPVGYSTDNLIIRFKSNLLDIVIEKFDVTGAVLDSNLNMSPVFPVPSRIEQKDKNALGVEILQKIVIAKNADEDSKFAANLLKEKLYEDYSISIPITYLETSDDSAGCGTVFIGKHGDVQQIDRAFSGMPQAEGYTLKTESLCAYINALDRTGLIMGVEALLQLFRSKAKQCTVKSEPMLPIRGIHMGMPPREELQFFKRLIRYVAAPMGYNTLFLEFAGGMRYNRHPEINEAWEKANLEDLSSSTPWVRTGHGKMVAGGSYLEQDEVAELVAYVRSYGIEVIPEVQSLSHVQYITCAHPEIGEVGVAEGAEGSVDERTEDLRPSDKFINSYCPSNEKSYEIIFDLIDEIVEVVKPKQYVHMGHDEVYTMGVCPKCKGKDHAVLFATHVNRIYDYLAGKHLKMMIWSDMLQPSTRYKTPPAIDMIPKDIVMLDFIWYFNFVLDYEDTLLDKDFKVMIGNLYSSHYTGYEQRIRKNNMIGAQISTWCRIDEETLAREGKFFDALYTANMMWSDRYSEDLRHTYSKMIASMLPVLRAKLHGEQYPSLVEGKTAIPISLPASKEKLPQGIANITHKIPPCGVQSYRGIPFDVSSLRIISYDCDGNGLCCTGEGELCNDTPNGVDIPVNNKFDSLVFLQAAAENAERIAWSKLVEIGEYVVSYGDGTSCGVAITYGGNIRAWYQRFGDPLPQQYYRHEGYICTYYADPLIETKSSDGRDVTVYGYEWINPFKDKEIVSIKCSATYESDAGIILFGITGIK